MVDKLAKNSEVQKATVTHVGTLDRIRNSGYKFNHTKEVMIIFFRKQTV